MTARFSATALLARELSRDEDYSHKGKSQKLHRLFSCLHDSNVQIESSETRLAVGRLLIKLGAQMSDPKSEGFSIDETAQWLGGGYLHPMNEYHMLLGLVQGVARRTKKVVPRLDWEYPHDSYEVALAEQLHQQAGSTKPQRPTPTLAIFHRDNEPD